MSATPSRLRSVAWTLLVLVVAPLVLSALAALILEWSRPKPSGPDPGSPSALNPLLFQRWSWKDGAEFGGGPFSVQFTPDKKMFAWSYTESEMLAYDVSSGPSHATTARGPHQVT